MTSREVIQKAIRFQRPPRLPVTMGCFGVSDVGGIPVKRPASFKPACEGADEWGCVWAHTEVKNMGQVKGNPLADIRKLDKHPVPDYTDDSRYVDVEATLAKLEAEGKYVMCGIFMVLFERMHTLHGFENTLVDLYEDRPAMEALADRIADVHIGFVKEVARRFPGRVDGWNISDDWGTQTAAFVSADLWMDFFLPRYKRIFDAMHAPFQPRPNTKTAKCGQQVGTGHAAGCDVWVHSCGKVNEIIEGYIRAGVNVVNLQQPRALGIAQVGERYRGRITFQSLADIQATLPTGDRRQIDDDAERLMRHWASPAGGFIFSDYGDDVGIGVRDPGTKLYMYQQFSRWSEKLYGQPLPEPIVPQAVQTPR